MILQPSILKAQLTNKITKNSFLLICKYLPNLYLALILFGQVFLSSIANILVVDNRGTMLAMRFLIMALSYWYIFSHFRREKLYYFQNLWIICLTTFWVFYLLGFSLISMFPKLNQLCQLGNYLWSLGSSFPIANRIRSPNRPVSILYSQTRHGLFSRNINCLFSSQAWAQSRSLLLKELECYYVCNVGCAMFLLCFGKILASKSTHSNLHLSQIIEWAGMAVGLFIVIYSATRGVLLAILLITFASIIFFRSSLSISLLVRIKHLWISLSVFVGVIVVASRSPLLLEKLFTASFKLFLLVQNFGEYLLSNL